MRFRSQNQPFNSPIGFDLGKIEDILISGNKTLSDKILIVKYDQSKQKYLLVPQEIQTIHGSTSLKIVLGEDDYNYTENLIFSVTTEHTDLTTTNNQSIFTIGVDVAGKKQGIITLKGQLFAKHYDINEVYEYYTFCTGRALFQESKSFSEVTKRIAYDKFTYIFNSGNLIFADDNQYKRLNYNKVLDKQYLIPSFSTIGNSNEVLKIDNVPYIEITETTDGLYLINIKCNPLLLDQTKYIKWFGNLELTVTAK